MKQFRPKYISCLFAAAVFVHSGGVVYAQEPSHLLESGSIQRIAIVSSQNQNPHVAYSPDGNSLLVAWDGIVSGNRRIILRERIGQQWLEPVIVDNNPAGANTTPNLAVDASGVIHISWIANVNGRRTAMYARRITRYPNAWFYQELPFSSDGNKAAGCDSLSMKLDNYGLPWFIWQAGFGSQGNILVTKSNLSGVMETIDLTAGSNGQNILPKIFFTPNAQAYWYVAQADQFYLIGANYEPKTGEWQLSPARNLEELSTDALPDLFQTEKNGLLSGIWYGASNLESLEKEGDGIYIGRQDEASQGRGQLIDQQPETEYRSVNGSGEGNTMATTWIAENYSMGAQVYAAIGTDASNMVPIKISSDSSDLNTDPEIAIHNHEVTIAWIEENETGSQRVAIRTLELPK